MVTIGNYAVEVGLNAGSLIDKTKLARNEIASLVRSFSSLATPAERFEKALDIAERGMTDEAKAAGALIEYEERLRQKYFGVSEAQQKAADAQRRHNEVMAEGERITQRLMTADERHEHELQKVNELYRQGAINAQTRDRAIAESSARLAEANERLRQKIYGTSEAAEREAEALKRDNAMIAEGERLTKRLMTAEERHTQDLRRVNELYRQGAIGATTRARAIAELSVKLAEASKEETKLGNAAAKTTNELAKPNRVASMTSSLSRMAAGYIGVRSAVNLARESILASANVEKAQASFSVLTGSADRAKVLLSEIRGLSASSPVSFSAATQAARTLLSFNVAAGEIMPTLRMLGEITGGDTERFKMLSLAFAQSSAAGRLMGQDLLQMINAGFNPLQEISRKTGRSIVDLKKDMEEARIPFSMVQEAFRSATAEGGLFHGMMDSIGNTSAGALQKANSAIELLKIGLGESLSPLVREVSNDIAELAKNSDKLKGSLDGAGSSLLGFYNFSKSEISLLPALGRGFSAFGDTLGNIADTIKTEDLFAKSKTMQGGAFVSFLEQNYEARRSEIDAMLRKQAHGDYVDINGMQTELSMQLEDFRRKLEDKAQKAKESLAAQERTMATQGTATKESEARSKAEEKVEKRYKTQVDSLKTAIEKLQEGKAAANGLKAELAGMTPIQQQHILNLSRQLEILEKQKKAQKEQATLREKMERDAERIRDKFYTPTEKLAKSLAEIDRLQRARVLTPFEAERARREAAKDSLKGMKIELPKGTDINSQEGADLRAKIASAQMLEIAKQNEAKRRKEAADQLNASQQTVQQLIAANTRLESLITVQPRNIR